MTNQLTANQVAASQISDEPKTAKLKQLAWAANEAHGRVVDAARHALLHSFEAGTALVQARNLCEPRGWLGWLGSHFKASARTAQRYMEFALECHRLGGLDAERVSHLAPEEANHALSRVLAVRRGKKKAPVAGRQGEAAPHASQAHALAAAQADSPTQAAAPATAAANPYLRFRELLEELMQGLRNVMNGEDCHDGPFAELLLLDLKPVYVDLLEYLEDRDHLRR